LSSQVPLQLHDYLRFRSRILVVTVYEAVRVQYGKKDGEEDPRIFTPVCAFGIAILLMLSGAYRSP
jgi:hypothetical protein